jgi:uncharacterized protein YbaR (Trm112 family)
MTLDPKLLAILVCPTDKGPLFPVGTTDSGDSPAWLYNPRLQRRYAVIDGIPDMRPGDAESVSDDEHASLMATIESEGIEATGGGSSAAS